MARQGVRGDVHGHLAAARVGVAQRDDVGVAGGVPGEEHGRLVGFGARGGEEALLEGPGSDLGQLLGQSHLGLVDVQGGDVLQRLILVDDRLVHCLVAVAHAHGQDAAEKVEILRALGVGDVHVFATDEREGLLVVGAHAGKQVFLLQALDLSRHFLVLLVCAPTVLLLRHL
jgi:hypothetical protein